MTATVVLHGFTGDAGTMETITSRLSGDVDAVDLAGHGPGPHPSDVAAYSIDGMAEADALDLLNGLLSHATEERFQYRHKWQPGDLVMWDNRCVLHKANGDYDHETQTRYLYRVMLQGDRPV